MLAGVAGEVSVNVYGASPVGACLVSRGGTVFWRAALGLKLSGGVLVEGGIQCVAAATRAFIYSGFRVREEK